MKKYIKKIKQDDGFTLIEMLIVIMIVSLLLLLVMTNVGGVQESVKTTTDKGVIQTVQSQMVIYKMKEGEDGTAEQLEKKGYINEEQLAAYNKAPTKLKDPNE